MIILGYVRNIVSIRIVQLKLINLGGAFVFIVLIMCGIITVN